MFYRRINSTDHKLYAVLMHLFFSFFTERKKNNFMNEDDNHVTERLELKTGKCIPLIY